MLISKAIVDGVSGGAGKYSAQQRQRLYRVGIREFFRLDAGPGSRIDTMGDCGAFHVCSRVGAAIYVWTKSSTSTRAQALMLAFRSITSSWGLNSMLR